MAKRTASREGEKSRQTKREAQRGGRLPAIGAEINCCFDSDTEIGLMKQKYIYIAYICIYYIESWLTKLTSQRMVEATANQSAVQIDAANIDASAAAPTPSYIPVLPPFHCCCHCALPDDQKAA